MNRFLASCCALLAGASLCLAQAPAGDPVIVSEPGVDWGESTLDACSSRFWVSGEYLYWWMKDSDLPVLVTSGDPNEAIPGALGSPATIPVLVGRAGPDEFSGGRFMAGLWLNEAQTLGLEGNFFFLGDRTDRLSAGSSGAVNALTLSRPFFNVTQNIEDVDPVSFPFVQRGVVNVDLSSELWGAEANLRANLVSCDLYRMGVLGGFRYLELEEGLLIQADTQTLPGIGGGDRSLVVDQFGTRNRFYGGQAGVAVEASRGGFLLDLRGKVGLGSTQQRLNINGSRQIVPIQGVATAFAAGLLAQPSNTGTFSDDQFTVVPELNVNLGYQLTGGLRATVGYTFLYWSEVARPADQIDRFVNTTQFPPGVLTGPARPLPLFASDDFWVQGFSVKLEVRY